MAKRKTRQPSAASVPLNERERGQQAFARSDFTGAIAAWTKVAREENSAAVERALAEAHFRRACQHPRTVTPQMLDDLKTAAELVLDDALYAYHLGLAYHRQGDRTRAIECYRSALQRDAYHARAAYMLCLALAETGGDPKADAAWSLLTPAQQEQLVPAENAFGQAMNALAASDWKKAEEHLQPALTSHPRLAHYYLGVIAWRRSDSLHALAHWLSAKASGLDTPALRHNLLVAYIHHAIQQTEQPQLIDTVRAGLRFAPDSSVLQTLRQRAEFMAGSRAAEAGDWKRALNHWQAARRSNPKAPRELLANLALAYEHLERWSEAADTWREVARRRPKRGENVWPAQHIAQVWRHADLLYARAGHFGKSAEMLRYAIRAQPDDLTLRLALVKRHMENGSWQSAEAAVMRVLEMTPEQPEALALRAQILDESSDLDLMIEAWERVLRLNDVRQKQLAHARLITLYAERAGFYATIEDHAAAVSEYEKALALAPDDDSLRARYGAALMAVDPQRAQAQFATVNPQDDEAVLTVLTALHQAGQHDAATAWLARVAAIKPPGAELLVGLGVDLLATHADLSKRYFVQAVERGADSERPHLFTVIAVAYASQDRMNEANDYIRQALKLDAGFGPAHFNLGLWDAKKGRRRDAAEHLQRALAWANRLKRSDIADGIEEAIDLLEERYVPTLTDILDTIDPDESDHQMRRLMGSLPTREVAL